jgi:uncharacterized membrane protein YfcA
VIGALLDLGPGMLLGLLGIGLVTGFLAGLLGIGGGMLMVPFLTFALTTQAVPAAQAVKMAIATAMATILFTSLSSIRAHHAHGAVNWSLWRPMAPGIVIGGLLAGGAAFAWLKGDGLALLFAFFNVVTALRLLRPAAAQGRRPLPGRWGQAGAGAGIGFVSGLVGAGGAFLSVPFMTACRVPMREAVATSAALGLPIAASNTLGYLWAGRHLPDAVPGAVGYLFVPGLLLIAAGSVSTAPWGARTAHRVDQRRLRQLFAALLLGLAAYMARQVVRS